uniref:Proteasome subunit beta n=1 Tax=Desulfobacca acetoxidans TaxID=60893 RepID=A0A7V6DQD6_9BACT
MTQALAAFDNHGLVLATDSRATRFTEGGQAEVFAVDKLFPLGKWAAILSGGAGVSVPLTQALRQAISQRRGLDDLEEMVEFALEFLSRGYFQYLSQHGPEPEGFRRIYFIMAGYSEDYPPPGYKLYLLGSEDNDPLQVMPVTNQVVMPRNLGMEMRLFKALAAHAPLPELLALSKDFLEKQAAAKEEVGPPYVYATITPAGYQPVEMNGLKGLGVGA